MQPQEQFSSFFFFFLNCYSDKQNSRRAEFRKSYKIASVTQLWWIGYLEAALAISNTLDKTSFGTVLMVRDKS